MTSTTPSPARWLPRSAASTSTEPPPEYSDIAGILAGNSVYYAPSSERLLTVFELG